MTNLQSKQDYQTNDPNNQFSIHAESSLHLPFDSSMCMMFTGHYNGFSVEIRSLDEMALIHHMGCFGKGTASRAKPKAVHNDGNPEIMRKRQFVKRNYWYKKFETSHNSIESDSFLKDADDLIAKIIHDTKHSGKDVIDLISSDDEEKDNDIAMEETKYDVSDKQNLVVIVPNSDSEDENYFANFKPKCCVDKIKLHEKLMLLLEESFFLLYGLGCLQIVNAEDNIMDIEECWNLFCQNDSYFADKYVVYHYFRSKGYVVKPGIKFGGDYLLYKDGPSINHADYIVIVNNGKDCCDWVTIFGQVRMAITTVKEVMIAEVLRPKQENIKMPQDLCDFRVRELVLTGKILTDNENDIN